MLNRIKYRLDYELDKLTKRINVRHDVKEYTDINEILDLLSDSIPSNYDDLKEWLERNRIIIEKYPELFNQFIHDKVKDVETAVNELKLWKYSIDSGAVSLPIVGTYPQNDVPLATLDSFIVSSGEIWEIESVVSNIKWNIDSIGCGVRSSLDMYNSSDTQILGDLCDSGYIELSVDGSWVETRETANEIISEDTYYFRVISGEDAVGDSADIKQIIIEIYFRKVSS